MTQFDYIILLLLALSVLLGWWRGLVYEILSLLSWVTAYFVAKSWVLECVPYMPTVLENEALKSAAAFGFVFVVTLILCGIAAWAIYRLAKAFGLDWRTDGVAGAIFGLVRGVLVVVLLVLLAGLTKLPQTAFWKESLLSKPLQQAAMMTKDLLPQEVATRITY